MPKDRPNGGRIGKYREWLQEEKLEQIEGWARDGLTEEDIAHNMGIARQTLNKWKQQYSSIGDALKIGKDVADRRVENALYKSALGFDYKETKTYVVEDEDGNKSKRAEVTNKVALPNITAQIFWLKNRKPEMWRDRKNIEVEDKTDVGEKAKDYRKFLDGLEDSDE